MTSYQFKQLINGQWVDAVNGGTWDLVNPATGDVIQQVPFGDAIDAKAAIDAASDAFADWAGMTPYERYPILMDAAQWLLDNAEELATITTEEAGKPYGESLAEWRSAPNYIIYAAEEAKRIHGRTIPSRSGSRRIQVWYQPLGVVGTITAWNFPVYNVVRAWSSALAAGCTVVGRPSEYTPRSGMAVAQAFADSGIPAGVVNLINGDPPSIGQAMLDDPRLRKIHFTGSTRVGKILMDGASRTVTQLSLELGGNAPFIVFPDVPDLEFVAEKAVVWKYRNCGQVCVSPQRFYIHEDIVDEFSDLVAEKSKALTLGSGLETSTAVGPLINEKQLERVEQIVAETVEMGATVLAGGQRAEGVLPGYFYEPTVLTGISTDSPVYRQEIFGPVLPIMSFKTMDEVLDMANDTEYGLTAFVNISDLNTALLMSERLEYGMVCINDWLPATPEAPMGGIKQSGLGRESGKEGIYEYLEEKTIFIGGVHG